MPPAAASAAVAGLILQTSDASDAAAPPRSAAHRLPTPSLPVPPPPSSQTFLDRKEVTERVLQVLKGFEKVDPAKVTAAAHFVNDLGLDSLDAVEVCMALEVRCGAGRARGSGSGLAARARSQHVQHAAARLPAHSSPFRRRRSS